MGSFFMAITPVDKIKIIKYLKDNPIGEIYYLDLCNALGKKCRIKDIEFLEFFVDSVIKEFKKDDNKTKRHACITTYKGLNDYHHHLDEWQ